MSRVEVLLPYPSRAETGADLTRAMWSVLEQLLRGHGLARRLQRSKWDFAVTIEELEKTVGDHNELRALLCQGLVEHAEETSAPPGLRRFRRRGSMRLNRSSCFVLSDWGLAVMAEGGTDKAVPVSTRPIPATNKAIAVAKPISVTNKPTSAANSAPTPPAPSACPVWDEDRRELRLGRLVLKRFRRPAKNQEAILAAFEEEGWPTRIDSPITNSNDASAAERVHNAVKRLNRQVQPFIRFESDGSGEGVTWLVPPGQAE
jgi:hypothetical protein